MTYQKTPLYLKHSREMQIYKALLSISMVLVYKKLIFIRPISVLLIRLSAVQPPDVFRRSFHCS